jgi:hypothetical protein
MVPVASETAHADDPPAVSVPRTWLLQVGWRRAGRIEVGA